MIRPESSTSRPACSPGRARRPRWLQRLALGLALLLPAAAAHADPPEEETECGDLLDDYNEARDAVADAMADAAAEIPEYLSGGLPTPRPTGFEIGVGGVAVAFEMEGYFQDWADVLTQTDAALHVDSWFDPDGLWLWRSTSVFGLFEQEGTWWGWATEQVEASTEFLFPSTGVVTVIGSPMGPQAVMAQRAVAAWDNLAEEVNPHLPAMYEAWDDYIDCLEECECGFDIEDGSCEPCPEEEPPTECWQTEDCLQDCNLCCMQAWQECNNGALDNDMRLDCQIEYDMCIDTCAHKEVC